MAEAAGRSHADLLTDNLKSARRTYYLILLVALFLIVTMIENDPARIPALERALENSRQYKEAQIVATGAWTELVGVARSTTKLRDSSYSVHYENASPKVSGLAWSAFSDCPDVGKSAELGTRVTRIWTSINSLAVQGAPTIAMETDAGSTEILVPTEYPGLEQQIGFLDCLSRLVESVIRELPVQLQATTSGAGEYDVHFVVATPPLVVQPGPQAMLVEELKDSPLLARVAFVLNREKLSASYIARLRTSFSDLKLSLSAVGLWETATKAQYNPTLEFHGQGYAKELIHNDSFFNEPALRQVTIDLERELRTRSTRLRIPLTSYEARVDVAVVLTGFILLLLYGAYFFDLHNIAELVPSVSTETTTFFPWPVLWAVRRAHYEKHFTFRWKRYLTALLIALHSSLGALSLGWVAIAMWRFPRIMVLEFLIAIMCCIATGAIGYYSLRSSLKIRAGLAGTPVASRREAVTVGGQ